MRYSWKSEGLYILEAGDQLYLMHVDHEGRISVVCRVPSNDVAELEID